VNPGDWAHTASELFQVKWTRVFAVSEFSSGTNTNMVTGRTVQILSTGLVTLRPPLTMHKSAHVQSDHLRSRDDQPASGCTKVLQLLRRQPEKVIGLVAHDPTSAEVEGDPSWSSVVRKVWLDRTMINVSTEGNGREQRLRPRSSS